MELIGQAWRPIARALVAFVVAFATWSAASYLWERSISVAGGAVAATVIALLVHRAAKASPKGQPPGHEQ